MKKIELAKEVAILENDIRNYRGQEVMEGETLDNFISKTSRQSKEVLETEINRLINVRKNAKEDFYAKEFYNSEAGKNLHNKLSNYRKAWMEDAYQQALATVQEVLGDDWTIAHWGSTSFEVGMKNHDTDLKKAWRATQFGHEIEIYYGYNLAYDYENHSCKRIFKFEANIGTMGSFNISADDSQAAFYIGVGKFLASPKVQELKYELEQLHKNIKETEDTWNNAEKTYVSKKVA